MRPYDQNLRAAVLVAFLWCPFACQATDAAASAHAVTELQSWLEQPYDHRPSLSDAAFAKIALTKGDAENARRILWADHEAIIRLTRKAEIDAKAIALKGLTMKFETVNFAAADQPPKTGRSLFLSLHGGGGAPASVNESQWRNQVKLGQGYHPAEGIYLAPRAPTDTWDLWHQPHIDAFFHRLIEDLIVLDQVNPNRIYILGYSAGGDGVYQLAPRMADYWAAASMMAGHPNDASPLGLRNIGFAIQAGANDGAYHRNEIAAQWGQQLDELQKTDPGGYVHFVKVREGKGHWMDMEDREAIPWMEKFTRVALPEKVVWRQSKVVHTQFYWLAMPEDKALPDDEIIAERHGQTITLGAKNAGQIIVRLNDAMLDLDQPVTVIRDGKEAFRGVASRTIATLASTIEHRGDPDLVFFTEITVPPAQP